MKDIKQRYREEIIKPALVACRYDRVSDLEKQWDEELKKWFVHTFISKMNLK